VKTRSLGFALAVLMVVAVSCGGTSSSDTGSSASDAPPSTSADVAGSGETSVSAACAKAMTDLAGTVDLSDDAMQPFAEATFTACRTAAEWDAAAEQHRGRDLDHPAVIIGNATADSVRLAFCEGIEPVHLLARTDDALLVVSRRDVVS
jgi:hypothetical protein